MRPLSPRVALLLVLACALPSSAVAFVTLGRTPPDATAMRWSAADHVAINGVGLYDGIQVAIEPDFSEKLAQAVTGHVDPTDVADIETAIAAAFAAWESPVLRFALTFAGSAQRGTDVGSEIDVFLVPEEDVVFTDNNYFGVTFTDATPVADRLLTNGVVSAGPAITGADIFINETILAGVAPALTRDQQLAALQRLLMHEIGHALGFHHPNEFPESNYDTDSDPLNVMLIDPDDPTAGLALSPNINPNSVVSNRPASFEALLFTSLQNDERGGRDVLYPLHAPECPGDCDDDRTVAVNELVQSVNIALDHAKVSTCALVDRNHDAIVRVDELVGAVRGALNGCPVDRRILNRATTSMLIFPVPQRITSGTIRFAVTSDWTNQENVPFVEITGPPMSLNHIRLLKLGRYLQFSSIDGSGFDAEISTPIDTWAADEQHVITATWSHTSIALYIDGEPAAEQSLHEPIVHQMGALLLIGAQFGNTTLENLEVFGRP